MASKLDDLIPSDLITTKEAARLVNNTHRNTIRRWILSGKIKAYKLGKRYLLSRADVLNLITPHIVHKPDLPPTKREMTAREAYVDQRLREVGVRK